MSTLRGAAKAVLPPRAVHAYRVLRHNILFPFEPELSLVPQFLSSTKAAIDVGADVGLYTSVMARRVAHTIAIEPNPESAAHLRRLGFPNCDVIEAAASDSNGECVLYVPRDRARGSIARDNPIMGEPAREYRVRTLTLDSIPEPGPVCFIKVDAEGHELAILRGAARILARDRPTIMAEVECRHGIDVVAFFSFLEQCGYRARAFVDGALVAVDAAGLVERQSPDLLRAKQVRSRFTGYINNVICLPR